MLSRKRTSLLVAFLPVAAFLVGCGDPAGPGLSGGVSLGPGVSVAAFKTLQLRAYPDPGGSFDASKIPTSTAAEGAAATVASTVAFPYAYSLEEPLGTTSNPNWRLVAWLSKQDDSSFPPVVPEKGDVLCTAVGVIHGCGTYGDYCGLTSGIDCTLATPLP